jgi:hypothetical protein
MTEMNPATAATRIAIEFLTLFLEPDLEHAATHISMALGDPDGPDAVSIIAGQCNVGMILVLELAKAQGAEDLYERAGEILQELSRQLPE